MKIGLHLIPLTIAKLSNNEGPDQIAPSEVGLYCMFGNLGHVGQDTVV